MTVKTTVIGPPEVPSDAMTADREVGDHGWDLLKKTFREGQ